MEIVPLPDFAYALLSERKGYTDSLAEKERTQNAGYLDIQQIHRSIRRDAVSCMKYPLPSMYTQG